LGKGENDYILTFYFQKTLKILRQFFSYLALNIKRYKPFVSLGFLFHHIYKKLIKSILKFNFIISYVRKKPLVVKNLLTMFIKLPFIIVCIFESLLASNRSKINHKIQKKLINVRSN
jgi:hypothetical protein